jgi:hypothetical protein
MNDEPLPAWVATLAPKNDAERARAERDAAHIRTQHELRWREKPAPQPVTNERHEAIRRALVDFSCARGWMPTVDMTDAVEVA